jgi:hypothetical protein
MMEHTLTQNPRRGVTRTNGKVTALSAIQEDMHRSAGPIPKEWAYAILALPFNQHLIAVVPLAHQRVADYLRQTIQAGNCKTHISTSLPSALRDGHALGPELHHIFPVLTQSKTANGETTTTASLVIVDQLRPYTILNFLARQKPASTNLPTHIRPLGYIASPSMKKQESCTVANAATQPITFSLTRYSPRTGELAVPANSFLQQGTRVVHVHRGLAQAAHRKNQITERVLASISKDQPPHIYFETRALLHGLR